jgi:hypothetical protein
VNAPGTQSTRRRLANRSTEHLLRPSMILPLRGMIAGVLFFLCLGVPPLSGAPATNFKAGVEAYQASDYSRAVDIFHALAAQQPSSGVLQNLGNAEWQRGRVGEAVLAWEQVLWVDPFDKNARNNLRFARDSAQLENPDLTWWEAVSGWLPVSWWAWITTGSLWLAVGFVTLPGVFRIRKASWQPAAAVLALGILLLTIPAHVGSVTRSRIGFVLQKDAPLRLTPTTEAEVVTRLQAGQPIRIVRGRGDYVFLRTAHMAGWLKLGQFGLISSK